MTEQEVRDKIAERTVSRREILGGSLIFRGTRILVHNVGQMARKGVPLKEMLEDYPAITIEDIELARRFIDLEPKPEAQPGKRIQFIRMSASEVSSGGR